MLPKHSLSQSARPRPLSVRALACHIAGERMMAAFARLQEFVEKAGFNPDQPRAPGGGPGGGQWIYVDDYAQGRQPGIGDNGGPPLDPPEPPKEPPKDKASRTQAAKELAKQILRRAGPIGALITVIEAAEHYSEIPSITSYQDAPKTLSELQQNAGKRRPGYEDHHIVEQGAGDREGFSRSRIDGADNVVSAPKYKHHEITGWYNKPNQNFGMQTPRNYLRGKDWSDHVSVGHQALREIGVLK
ncbi:conserved hypothetical protein [Bosea sp. 62]|uniref:hypothetical protein n=1 Tax=unclassified Bosea (in: a-proteobacteria) TaxID=2653178 RepID=UPI0012535EB6|nr:MULTISPECIES: hypothetical protein [unclassified Bosea (in: a-proteobacteria)]CAD5294354.1 conserved hypothetical protein [Bosea sp. 7B]CAD5297940.1 conserved hypothetical protein [Bosea sp. 21B]CAD5298116.1 conserved hypothetical protein [Bosea sp. 46]VVT61372.1 conserved hypothetical protein [Bosea sp. EC-HK365B]VXB17875.1 conserved hypothetical protein [Bosea sp. 127]